MVRLPGNRLIIIDAKVPLSAYLDSLEEEESKKEALLETHAKQVRTHIQNLAKKSYWAGFDPTPEFVVLFIPGENFFSAALSKIPELIEYITRFITLQPGDIICTGTPEGVSPLKDGDIMEATIEGFGILKNPVVER